MNEYVVIYVLHIVASVNCSTIEFFSTDLNNYLLIDFRFRRCLSITIISKNAIN